MARNVLKAKGLIQSSSHISIQWRRLLIMIYINLLSSMDTHNHKGQEKLAIKRAYLSDFYLLDPWEVILHLPSRNDENILIIIVNKLNLFSHFLVFCIFKSYHILHFRVYNCLCWILGEKLGQCPARVIGAQFTGLLLSRYVLMDSTARLIIITPWQPLQKKKGLFKKLFQFQELASVTNKFTFCLSCFL